MWKLAEGEIDCQLETSKDIIPYSGDTFTMNVKSNTSWKVSTPVWMTANPSEGTGSGVVTIDVARSTESQQRNGKISVMFSSDPDNNIAGELSKEMYVKQEAYWESVRVTIQKHVSALTNTPRSTNMMRVTLLHTLSSRICQTMNLKSWCQGHIYS